MRVGFRGLYLQTLDKIESANVFCGSHGPRKTRSMYLPLGFCPRAGRILADRYRFSKERNIQNDEGPRMLPGPFLLSSRLNQAAPSCPIGLVGASIRRRHVGRAALKPAGSDECVSKWNSKTSTAPFWFRPLVQSHLGLSSYLPRDREQITKL